MNKNEKSKRLHESPDPFWKDIFEGGFGTVAIVAGITAWLLLIIYLETSEAGGGFGTRAASSTQYFNWHPLLMGTAFLLIMTPAVLSFEIFPFLRHTNKNIHGTLNTLAFLAMIAGYAIIVDCHTQLNGTGLFGSVHAFVGFSTIVIVTCNYCAAFVLYVVKFGGDLRGTLKPLHKRFGLVAVLLGLATICLGMQDTFGKHSYATDGITFQLGIAVALLAVVAFLSIVFSVPKFMNKNDSGVEYMSTQTEDPDGNYML